MPVTKSAKKALRTAQRRYDENLQTKDLFKQALKLARKAINSGESTTKDLISKAQSSLDKAAKKNTIHPNKASRLKSRLAKKVATPLVAPKSRAKAKAKPKTKAKA